jgi:hypothetical protein
MESMKRATITIPDDLDEALAAYGQDHGLDGDLDAVVGAALRDLLTIHGYLEPFVPFDITPIPHDGPEADISVNHDRYFVDGEMGGPR